MAVLGARACRAATPQKTMDLVWVHSSPQASSSVMETSSGERVLERACAECRRSKSHCDKRVPCSTCTKKGLKHLCPDDALQSSEGNKRFWNATFELREKSGELSQRISELEEALRASHALHSSTRHPLLTDNLLTVKDKVISRAGSPNPHNAHDLQDDKPQGSLNMRPDGNSHYYGSCATGWWYVKVFIAQLIKRVALKDHQNENRGFNLSQGTHNTLPAEIANGSATILHMLLGSAFDPQEWMATMRCYLPELEEVQRQLAIYYEYGACEVYTISIQQTYNELLPAIYQTYDPFTGSHPAAHHKLAILFGVLSISALLDPSVETGEQAANYHALCQAALVSGRVMEYPTCEAIQALLVLATYYPLAYPADYDDTVEWSIVGLATRLSQTMGLHREPMLFGLDNMEALKRRMTHMAVCSHDAWTAFKWNLPPATQKNAASVIIPMMNNPTIHDFYFIWKYTFSRECLQLVNEVLTAPVPSYAAIMEADAKIRSHEFPPAFEMPSRDSDQFDITRAGDSISMTIIRTTSFIVQQQAIFILHRDHAHLATTKYQADPLKSGFGNSVMACFRSAKAMISAIRSWTVMRHRPLDSKRLYVDMLFTAGSALAAFIIRCPTIMLAQEAMASLDIAVALLNTPTSNQNALTIKQILAKLHGFATASFYSILQGTAPPNQDELTYAEELLKRVGGSTRLTRFV